jgi:hypothetical protein
VCPLHYRPTPSGVVVANVAQEPTGKNKESPRAGVNEGEGQGEAGGDEGAEGEGDPTVTDGGREKKAAEGEGVQVGDCLRAKG